MWGVILVTSHFPQNKRYNVLTQIVSSFFKKLINKQKKEQKKKEHPHSPFVFFKKNRVSCFCSNHLKHNDYAVKSLVNVRITYYSSSYHLHLVFGPDLPVEDVRLGRRSYPGDQYPAAYPLHRPGHVRDQRGVGAQSHSCVEGSRRSGWQRLRLCLVRGHAPTTSFLAGVDRAAAGVGSGSGQRLRVHHSL